MNSQLSFTGKETLSRISEETEDVAAGATIAIDNNVQKKSTHSYAATAGAAFEMGSWEHTNPIMFSVAPTNPAKNNVANGLDTMESQVYIYVCVEPLRFVFVLQMRY